MSRRGFSRLAPTLAFIVSGVMLAYEILLTRIASVLLTSQYLFLILSVALLGIAAGAIAEYWLARGPERVHASVGGPLGWTAIAMLGSLLLILRFGAGQGLLVLAVVASLPFACSGLLLARLFRLQTQRAGLLYAADLGGAATGALLVPVLLPAFGASQSVLLLAALLGAAAAVVLLLERLRWRTAPMALAGLGLVGLAILNQGDAVLGEVPVGRDPDKDLYRMAVQEGLRASIVESRWSTFGRTDLVRFGADSTVMSIFVDGAAGASMLRFDGDFSDPSPALKQATLGFGGAVPLVALRDDQKDDALVIGPGGGRDVLLALVAGVKRITAVDVNPQMIDLVRDHGAFNGHLYSDYPNVKIIVDEGRRFLRHSRNRYDLILLFMPITKSSRGLNAFALSESYLFTREAFRDYHDHLTDEGTLLIMAHGMPEATKLLSTAVGALEDDGLAVSDAMRHVFLLGSPMMPLFGMQKAPVSTEIADVLHAGAHLTVFDCALSFIPGVRQEYVRARPSELIDAGVPMMSPLFIDVAEGRLPVTVLRSGLGYNFMPASDDRPFFFQYGRQVPDVVLMVLGIALAALTLVLRMPVRRARSEVLVSPWFPAFFTAIGVGFIVVELAMVQRIGFYLGDPSKTLALLVSALLVGSGVGSLISRRSAATAGVVGGFVTASALAVLLAALPLLFKAADAGAAWMSPLVAAALLGLLGVPMGMMFPVGLRIAEQRWGQRTVPWMWAVNGCASVAGGAMAVAISMQVGNAWTLVAGAAAYFVAAIAMMRIAKDGRIASGLGVRPTFAGTTEPVGSPSGRAR